MFKQSKKRPATTTGDILFKDPNLPTIDELIEMAKKLDKQFPGDNMSRAYVRSRLQELDCPTDPWEKLGLTWSEFRRQCNFAPARHTTKLINQTSRHASVDHLRKASEERLSWGDVFIKPDNGERYKTIVGAGDFHDIECDPFAFRMLIERIAAVKPDVVSIHGDMFDATEFGKYYQDPREYNLRARIEKVHEMFAAIREASPDSQIDLIEGNHEARIHKMIIEAAPAVADILTYFHGMDVRKLLGLDQYEVNYVAKGDLFAFSDRDLKNSVEESERIYWNTVWVRHTPPKQTNVTMPGFHGHHHKHKVTPYQNPVYGAFEWHQLGGMHKREASYTNGLQWTVGFITGVVDTQYRRVLWDYTDVGDTSCINGGKFFERRGDEFYAQLESDLDVSNTK